MQEQQLWCFADDAKTQRLEASTFVEFVRTVGDLHDKGHRLQHHLEPQTRALLGVPFDRIVKIEELDQRADELMDVLAVQVRPGHLNRQVQGHDEVDGAWRLRPSEFTDRPTVRYGSFWNEELTTVVRRAYAKDCELYESL